MTYALCALASCAAITDKTSACGCKYETKTVGKFSVDISSSVLIKSPTFRDVVMLVRQRRARPLFAALQLRQEDGPRLHCCYACTDKASHLSSLYPGAPRRPRKPTSRVPSAPLSGTSLLGHGSCTRMQRKPERKSCAAD